MSLYNGAEYNFISSEDNNQQSTNNNSKKDFSAKFYKRKTFFIEKNV